MSITMPTHPVAQTRPHTDARAREGRWFATTAAACQGRWFARSLCSAIPTEPPTRLHSCSLPAHHLEHSLQCSCVSRRSHCRAAHEWSTGASPLGHTARAEPCYASLDTMQARHAVPVGIPLSRDRTAFPSALGRDSPPGRAATPAAPAPRASARAQVAHRRAAYRYSFQRPREAARHFAPSGRARCYSFQAA